MDDPIDMQATCESLCLDHIIDPELKRQVEARVTLGQCNFCGKSSPDEPAVVPLDAVTQRVFDAATTRFRSFEEGSSFEGESWETPFDTNDVVNFIADGAFDDKTAEKILNQIAEAIVTPQQWFEEDTRDQFAYSWERFAETVRHEARFVFIANSRRGGEHEPPARLARFLEGLLGYADKRTRMLQTLPTGSKLYRGRMTDDLATLRAEIDRAPAQKLGTAPPDRAAAGRMSGEGVPLFYCADNVHTAVAEIALHSQYDFAVVGEFITQRPVTILDFTRKPKIPSIFDLDHKDQRMFAEFVDDFVSAITRPVILDGRERVGYLPTQVVTEYLRWVPSRRIDGIAFPSHADSRGKNVVLFSGQGEDVVTDLPIHDERQNSTLTQIIGGRRAPIMTISPRAVSEHSVTRSVRVKNL